MGIIIIIIINNNFIDKIADAGDYEKSKKYGQELLSISEKLDEKEQKAQAYVVLAWSYYKGRDYEQSKTYGQKFLSISQKLGEREQEAKAYNFLPSRIVKKKTKHTA